MRKTVSTLLCILFVCHFFKGFAQNEKPKTQVTKKSEASCDSYTEFKKKQKIAKEQKAKEASKQETKK